MSTMRTQGGPEPAPQFRSKALSSFFIGATIPVAMDPPKGLGRAFQRVLDRRGHVQSASAAQASGITKARMTHLQATFLRPCTGLRGIAQLLSESPQTSRWHMAKLAEMGWVRSREIGHRRVYAPDGYILDEDLPVLLPLCSKPVGDVLRYVAEMGQTTMDQIAAGLGIEKATLSRTLDKLEDMQIIRSAPMGRVRAVALTGWLEARSDLYAQRFPGIRSMWRERLAAAGFEVKTLPSRISGVELAYRTPLLAGVLRIYADPYTLVLRQVRMEAGNEPKRPALAMPKPKESGRAHRDGGAEL